MSRTYFNYGPEWQKKKKHFAKSVFHSLQMLSPLEERSNEWNPTQEVFASPSRPYSPLPPLIIEEVSTANKHDEPEEYYDKLYKKIKRIYKKLFIENRNINSIDYGSNYSDSSVGDDIENNGSLENQVTSIIENNSPDNGNGNFDSITEDREDTHSSASTNSNGYGADFESMEITNIDVVNDTASNEDDKMITEEKESDSENTDGDGIRNEDSNNLESSENKESSRARIDESHHSIIDDHEMTENEESRESEDEQNYETEGSDDENIDEYEIIEETSQTVEPDIERIDDPVVGGEESHHSSIHDHEMAENEKSREPKDEQNYEKEGSDDENIDEHEIIEETSQTVEPDKERIYDTILGGEESHHSSIDDHEEAESDKPNEPEDEQSYEKGDSVSGSIKSIILPTRFRRAGASRNADLGDRIVVFQILEEIADPETVPPFDTAEEDFEEEATPQPDDKGEEIIEKRTPQADVTEENEEEMYSPRLDAAEEHDEEMYTIISLAKSAEEETEESEILPEATREDLEKRMGSPQPIEQMRTPRRDLSNGKTSTTHRSHSESTSEKFEHSAVPQEPTALTSSTQDGTDHNLSELQTSNEMNEMIRSIINESQNKDRTPISGRKRKLVDKSVQTVQPNRVTWQELLQNLLGRTPKMYRLCACGHICPNL